MNASTRISPHPAHPALTRVADITLLFVVFALCTSFEGHPPRGWPAMQAKLVERWGIKVEGIRRSAASYMLDFRYQVVDAEKAKPVFDRRTKPLLIHEATGARFVVPSPAKTGPLRNSDLPRVNRGYFMFFANPGKFIKAGDRVTVEIGDFRAENLVVR
jgi:hypothetical protein